MALAKTFESAATSSSLGEIKRLVFGGYGIGRLLKHILADDLAQQRLWRHMARYSLAERSGDVLNAPLVALRAPAG